MPRDVHIPLFLWICAAVCAHFLLGGGGLVVGKIHDDHSAILSLLVNARDKTRMQEQTFELALDDPNAKPPEVPPEEEVTPPEVKPEDVKKDEEKKDEPKIEPPKVEPPKVEPPKAPDPKKPEPPKVEPPKKAEPKKPEPPKPPEEKKIVVVPPKKDEPPPPKPPEDPLKDKRIAVRQQVKPDQKDNPTAKYIGDQANKVEEETRATITNRERDDKLPTPGGNHTGPDKAPGDSDRTKIADADEHKGDPRRAPGERGTEFDVQRVPAPLPAPVAIQGPPTNKVAPGQDNKAAPPTPPAAAPPAPNGPANPAPKSAPAQPGNPTPPPGGQQSPSVQNSPDGSWTWKPTNPNPGTGPASSSGPGIAKQPPKAAAAPIFGRGVKPAVGNVNPNLSQGDVTAIVGQGEIKRMREADGERRKSEHKGSWTASSFERWRSSIENYVATVKPGNQTSLNTAQSPFATYLNGMHNRIHPFFADAFLGSLDGLPKEHPLNNTKMVTRLEIILTKDGHLKKMGIVKTSGVTAFDIAALDAVNRAAPFGPPPTAIVSKDGNVYLWWEFHRDEVYACSTMNARPFLLNIEPAAPPVEPPPPGPVPTAPQGPQEKGPPPPNTPDTRSGWWLRPPQTTQQIHT